MYHVREASRHLPALWQVSVIILIFPDTEYHIFQRGVQCRDWRLQFMGGSPQESSSASLLHLIFVAYAFNGNNAVKPQLLPQVFNIGINRPVNDRAAVSPQIIQYL